MHSYEELTFLHFFSFKKTLWLGYNHLTLSFPWPRQVVLRLSDTSAFAYMRKRGLIELVSLSQIFGPMFQAL